MRFLKLTTSVEDDSCVPPPPPEPPVDDVPPTSIDDVDDADSNITEPESEPKSGITDHISMVNIALVVGLVLLFSVFMLLQRGRRHR